MKEKVVYRTWDETMADMAAGLLRAEGIPVRKVTDMPRSVYPMTMDGLGEIRIAVPEKDAEAAVEILAVRFSGDDEDADEDETGDEDDEE